MYVNKKVIGGLKEIEKKKPSGKQTEKKKPTRHFSS
jgi:hypothetical protein